MPTPTMHIPPGGPQARAVGLRAIDSQSYARITKGASVALCLDLYMPVGGCENTPARGGTGKG